MDEVLHVNDPVVLYLEDVDPPGDENVGIAVGNVLRGGRISAVDGDREKAGPLAVPPGECEEPGKILSAAHPHGKWRHGHAAFFVEERDESLDVKPFKR